MMMFSFDVIATIIIIKTQMIKDIYAYKLNVNNSMENINITVPSPETIGTFTNISQENKTVLYKDNNDDTKNNITIKLNTTKGYSNISDEFTSKNESKENYDVTYSKFMDSKHKVKKELPLTIIIVGPAAAFGICLFLCIAYYFHNMQLNNRAKRLSFTLYVTPDSSSENTRNTNFNNMCSQKLVPPSPNFRSSRDELFSQKRKSTLTAPTLTVPANIQHKRGSSWSAFADQEMLSIAAPRRHSTFII